MANLLALPKVERERLLGGNWKIRAAAGLLFKRLWVKVVDAAPTDLRIVRGWDLAGTPKTEGNDPDWTAGTKIGVSRSTGRYIVLHHVRDRDTPHKVEALTGNAFFGFVPSAEYIRPLVGMALNTTAKARQNPTDNYQFLIMGALGLEIRADFNGKGGVFYSTVVN